MNLRRQLIFAAVVLAGGVASQFAAAQAPAPAKPCGPGAVIKVVCGVSRPEDLVQVPGSPWIIASNLANPAVAGSGGLTLIDSRAHTATKVDFVIGKAVAPYEACPGPVDPTRLSGHGLSIRTTGRSKARLLVVGHGGREAVEVFDVDTGGAKPVVTWVGCVPGAAGGQFNSLVGLANGRIIVSQFLRTGMTTTDAVLGKITGSVFSWSPGDKAFAEMPGTGLPGPNGVEITPDQKYLLIAVTGLSSVLRYDLADTTKAPTVLKTEFRTDNLRWGTDGRLLLAGPGGAAGCQPAPGKACPLAPVVGALDVKTMALTELLRAPEEPGFPGTSSALIVGKTLWLGSYQADRVAYVELSK